MAAPTDDAVGERMLGTAMLQLRTAYDTATACVCMEERMLDTVMLRLRTADGLDMRSFAAEYGADAASRCVAVDAWASERIV
eukprot:scaffold38494_cov22-Tisochrysis_lutea.AAC.1